MFSTFSQETTSPPKTFISIPNSHKMPVSTPISIPKKSDSDGTINEYHVDLNFFNPSKASPPDYWKNRLEQRMKKFYDENIFDKE